MSATPILRYREYYTFQGYYRLEVSPSAAAGGTTGEEVFAKAVLYVVKWLKERVSEDSYMKSMIEAEYSGVEDYKDFLLRLKNSRGFEQRGEKEYDLNIFCYTRPDLNWALRLTEPDNGRETQEYPGRIFITDISLQCAGGTVRLAIRMTCREPQNITSEALLFRTAFLSEIYKDPDIMMYEGTMAESRYPANGTVIALNTKSETDCRDMYDGLINSEERQMPIAFLPAGEEDTEVYADKLGGIAYVVMEQEAKNYAKLFGKIMDRSELSDAVKAGRYICILPRGCEEDAQIFDDRDELKRYLKRYPVCRDGVAKKPGITYGENLFYKRLWAKYITAVEDAADTELFAQLNERIAILQQKSSDPGKEDEFRAQAESLQKTIEEMKARIENLKRKNSDYIAQIDERKAENNRLKARLREYEAEPEVDEEAAAREESRLRKEKLREETEQYLEQYSARPAKKEDVLPWIRENFSKRIELHTDAEKAYRKVATSDLPVSKFCDAIVLLNAVADNRYGELDGDVLTEIKTEFSYCDVSHTGFDRKDAPPAAFIRLAGESEKRLLNGHIKYSANTNAAFRIYYLFDDEHERVVIGSMPDHLAQSVTDSNFGNRKEKA